ncbi:unnamed protein product [Triticum turgidum subsp. durum]|uniref:Uncharacterized protein n=1 Tax=Triticum turgidum subsp. durum TaxID=4567 RepID=A0A9R1QS83_TRITD|nr:unnamed protein product [Triticum turgidum subsp. durum]
MDAERIQLMLSKMHLAIDSSDPERDRSKLSCGDDMVRANATIAEAIKSMLEIGILRHWHWRAVADTISTENIGLAELTLLTKDGRRCTEQDLVAYGGQMRSFVDACPNTLFSGFARLELENLRLPKSESNLPKILGIYEWLAFLHF